MYQADFVPVGEDQVPHVELTREVAQALQPVLPPQDVSSDNRDAAAGLRLSRTEAAV